MPELYCASGLLKSFLRSLPGDLHDRLSCDLTLHLAETPRHTPPSEPDLGAALQIVHGEDMVIAPVSPIPAWHGCAQLDYRVPAISLLPARSRFGALFSCVSTVELPVMWNSLITWTVGETFKYQRSAECATNYRRGVCVGLQSLWAKIQQCVLQAVFRQRCAPGAESTSFPRAQRGIHTVHCCQSARLKSTEQRW